LTVSHIFSPSGRKHHSETSSCDPHEPTEGPAAPPRMTIP
jgi:hypothetical protein